MSQFPQLNLDSSTVTAVIKTNRGDIRVALFPEQAPKTVKNFIELSKKVTMMELSSTELSLIS